MTHSRALTAIAGLAIVGLASACEAEHEPPAEDTGVFTLEAPPASDPDVGPPRDVTGSDDTPAAAAAAAPELPEAPPEPREPDPREAPSIDGADPANGGPDRREPTAPDGAGGTSGADPAPAAAEPTPQHEPRPLTEQPEELVVFQSAVVALPSAFDVAMFAPPSHDDVTVVNVLTDRLRYDDAVIFMREALEQAGWHITEQRDQRAGLVRFEADRDGETVGVRIHLAVDAPDRPQTVAINVEHTR